MGTIAVIGEADVRRLLDLDQLREALQASTVQVVANRVLASAAVDSRTIVRASKEITGHGGGCPPGGACGPDKICLCHRIDDRHEQTTCYLPRDVAGRIALGDRCGPCEGNDGHNNNNGQHDDGQRNRARYESKFSFGGRKAQPQFPDSHLAISIRYHGTVPDRRGALKL